MKKERVDILAYQQGLFETREKAKRGIMAGLVYNENDCRLNKPGEKIAIDSSLQIIGKALPYVSRAGLKLEKALNIFDFDLQNKIVLDIGASTGGFTDVALQNQAKLVYALDVGYNQLSWKIRQNKKVFVMERTNFRYSQSKDFTKGIPQIATIDVSFISLKKIFPILSEILVDQGDVIALIKPQFEAEKKYIGKNGIVRDHYIHEAVLRDILNFSSDHHYDAKDLSFSPITGRKGNIEFIIHLRKSKKNGIIDSSINCSLVVSKAHQQLIK